MIGMATVHIFEVSLPWKWYSKCYFRWRNIVKIVCNNRNIKIQIIGMYVYVALLYIQQTLAVCYR